MSRTIDLHAFDLAAKHVDDKASRQLIDDLKAARAERGAELGKKDKRR